jgi:FkbM family methyltransferase
MPNELNVDLLEKYKATSFTTEAGCYTNWLGLKTDASMFALENEINGRVFADVPVHGDGVYGGYAEYASLLTAIDQTDQRDRFTAVELGAGWGPWIAAVGKVCQNLGFSDVRLVGVEADEEKYNLMAEHMERNGLSARLIHGAAWSEDTTLKFPKIHRQDHGAAASVTGEYADPDYRGFVQDYVDVEAFSLRTICEGLDHVDYMHWDIQGAELAVAQSDPDFLNSKVRYLFIGTHSRPIEGRLTEFLYENGWDILLQNPCVYSYDRTKPSIEGMTTTDGEIFARNPHFSRPIENSGEAAIQNA